MARKSKEKDNEQRDTLATGLHAMDSRTDHLIDLALEEDAGLGDVTSRAIFSARDRARAFIEAKQDLVICGLGVAERVFACVDPALQIKALAHDGDRVKAGGRVLNV